MLYVFYNVDPIAVVALLGIGYNQTQVQPALGLFGTLLGYLMGVGKNFNLQKRIPHRGVYNQPENSNWKD